MAFDLWPTPFVGTVTTISAEFLNKVRTELARAIDGQGGSYTPTDPLRFLGSGIVEFGGTSEYRVTGANGLFIESASKLEIDGELKYVSSNITRYAQMSAAFTPDPNRWAFESITGSTGANAPRWHQPSNANTHPLMVPLVLPIGATLISVSMNIKGAAGHGALPTDKPSIEVVWQPIDDDTATEVDGAGPAVDSSASTGAFEASHQVSRLSYAEVVSSTRRYWARIRGEGGANAVDGLQLFSVRSTCTVTAQSKWSP
jgi:hypothetical protein